MSLLGYSLVDKIMSFGNLDAQVQLARTNRIKYGEESPFIVVEKIFAMLGFSRTAIQSGAQCQYQGSERGWALPNGSQSIGWLALLIGHQPSG